MTNNQVEVKFKMKEDAQAPEQGLSTDFGTDLYIAEDTLIVPGMYKAAMVGTGLHTEFDTDKYGMLIVPRSSMSLIPLSLANHVGVIEGTYRGEIKLPLRNVLSRDLSMYSSTTVVLEWAEHAKELIPTPVEEIPAELVKKMREDLHKDLNFFTAPGGRDRQKENIDKFYADAVVPGTVFLRKGTRVAQAFLTPKIGIAWKEVTELSETERGSGGFGSTNKKETK